MCRFKRFMIFVVFFFLLCIFFLWFNVKKIYVSALLFKYWNFTVRLYHDRCLEFKNRLSRMFQRFPGLFFSYTFYQEASGVNVLHLSESFWLTLFCQYTERCGFLWIFEFLSLLNICLLTFVMSPYEGHTWFHFDVSLLVSLFWNDIV